MIEEKFYEELVSLRHYLHAHPELSEQEKQTTAFIKEKLQSWHISVLDSSLKTGLVAQIGTGKPVIALRADLDGLPVQEQTKLPFASENAGVMHACGHDLHMTSLLGAAKILKAQEKDLKGTIKLIFQPAEEIGTGANQVLATHLLDDVQLFIGYHNLPTQGTGTINLREEGIMATCDRFKVVITGAGSHAAYPHEGRDRIIATSAIIQNLQTIISRNVSPLKAAVLSITHVEAGNTWNVIPEESFFEGTIRTFDEKVWQFVKQRFTEVIENTAKAYGVSAQITWEMQANLTYNQPELTHYLYQKTKT